ncbi:hypothetical protein [Curtobacterium aurantiacum]|uniref:Asp23/Gls24 family envelope stress response protein n=1 Tax=Curtobacterium aurantiacum TaxID=3236919 RepID=A0ABS5VLB9_9MICO|nr:hypothetical protein [Curtobacterium flaccumfaciens]MBT1547077.1 hypothetical protein [Curtobacterium flaccumfaciens pv. flaccumfaciens]MBT1589613.1 hypothetical protein [Curtobacterium flaccumfaciens pv. flaccumfaciens]MBT1681403.1 hypothetical protein [Curtobacterium flaccumfaciens pv. flaccumfaciens]
MPDRDSDMAIDLERQITAMPGVARVYPQPILRSLAESLRSPNALRSRVTIDNGVVSVIIGTADGSVAREVAHEVYNTVVCFLSTRDLPLVRVDIKIATIGAGHR